jgi:energy-coupling factor transport system permease protein
MPLLTGFRASQYVPANSPVHRLDARTKLLATGCIILCALLVGQPLAYVVLGVLLLGVTALAQLPARLMWTTYRFVFLGIAVGAVITIILFPGHARTIAHNVLITTRTLGLVVAAAALLAAFLIPNRPLPHLYRVFYWAVIVALAGGALLTSGAVTVHLGGTRIALRLVLIVLAAAGILLLPERALRTIHAPPLPSRVVFLTIAAAGLVAAVAPEQPVLHLASLNLSDAGLTYGLRLLGQLTVLVYTTGLLTMTTPPLTLTTGLQRLLGWLSRLRVPVEEIALVVTLGLTFLPLIQQQLDRVLTAQLARGADFRHGSWEMRGRNALALFVPLLVANLRRAEDLALAMEARGYHVGAPRTHLQVQVMGRRDVLALAVTVLVVVAIYLKWR